MTPIELFQAYKRGWSIGATGRAHDSRFADHTDWAFRREYERGHRDGCNRQLLDMSAAAERLGYDAHMSILRARE